MSQRKRPKDLRAGLADVYGARPVTVTAEPADETVPAPAPAPAAPEAPRPRGSGQIGRVGGAPAVMVEQQRQGLMRENEELRAELERIQADSLISVDLDPARVIDRYPPDRMPQAFADEAFESLVRSIEEHGQDQPILVRPHPDKPDLFEIAYGRRRREACKRLGRPVRAHVRALGDDELLQLMLRENEEREDLSLYERARFMRSLSQQEKLSVRQLGKRLGISPGYVSRLLRLPELPEPLLALVGDPRPLSMRTLEALAEILGSDDDHPVDRIVDGWGRIKPSASADGRARQMIRLALAQIPVERPQPLEIRDSSGKLRGRVKLEKNGKVRIELAGGLAQERIDALLEAIRTTLDA